MSGLFPEEPDRLAREYDDRFAAHVERVRAEPGIVEAVHGLRARGVRTALVTNNPAAPARRVLETIGLHEALPVIAAGDEVARVKHDPDLVHLALARLGTGALRRVLVGDTDLDRRAGWAARVAVVGTVSTPLRGSTTTPMSRRHMDCRGPDGGTPQETLPCRAASSAARAAGASSRRRAGWARGPTGQLRAGGAGAGHA
jgi:beta-phosphoglucomutase-like phosphatase (HAD superfamily)